MILDQDSERFRLHGVLNLVWDALGVLPAGDRHIGTVAFAEEANAGTPVVSHALLSALHNAQAGVETNSNVFFAAEEMVGVPLWVLCETWWVSLCLLLCLLLCRRRW